MLILHILSASLLLLITALSYTSLLSKYRSVALKLMIITCSSTGLSGFWLIIASGTTLGSACLQGGLMLALITLALRRQLATARA